MTENYTPRSLWLFALLYFILCTLFCTYDSTPPDASQLNDGKPLLMIDAGGFTGQRRVRLQFADLAGTTTLETAAEKTDATGRFLYPLYMTRGTRNYTLVIVVDQSGDGAFTGGSGDRTYQHSSGFATDGEIKKLTLANTTDFSAY